MKSFIEKQEKCVWLLPMHENKMIDVPSAELCPIHIVTQHAVYSEGSSLVKHRPHHDLSLLPHQLKQDLSVSKIHATEDVPNIQCSRAMECFLHALEAIRRSHPKASVCTIKFDSDSTFRSLTLTIALDLNTIIAQAALALTLLQVQFRARLSSSFWSLIAELMADMTHSSANEN